VSISYSENYDSIGGVHLESEDELSACEEERKFAKWSGFIAKFSRWQQSSLPPSMPARTYSCMALALGIAPTQLKWLLSTGYPLAMLNIMLFINIHMATREKVELVDMFSGKDSPIWTAFSAAGLPGHRFDREFDPKIGGKVGGGNYDFCSTAGLLTAVFMLLCLRAGGCAPWGTVCSSWVFVLSFNKRMVMAMNSIMRNSNSVQECPLR
jgi:hypothetical protein